MNAAAGGKINAVDPRDRVAGAWLVALVPGVDPAKAARPLAKAAGGKAARIYRHTLRGFEFRGTEAQVRKLAQDARVRTITPDRKLSLLAETVPPGVTRIAARDPAGADAHDAGLPRRRGAASPSSTRASTRPTRTSSATSTPRGAATA